MVDNFNEISSLGVASENVPDQYADGKAATVWELYIGHDHERTSQYKKWIFKLLRENNCHNVLDVACGTGVDSILLLEEGFDVFSSDASDKMLKYALRKRWNRRREPAFDKWVIDEANWVTLAEDLKDMERKPVAGFDAVFCLGNSFSHLLDLEGTLSDQKIAIGNFLRMVKPGGILVIDHRNYDDMLSTGSIPARNIYYNSDYIVDIKSSHLYVNGHPNLIVLDYLMDLSKGEPYQNGFSLNLKGNPKKSFHHFRLSHYPYRLDDFTNLLDTLSGPKATHTIYGDFKPIGEIRTPAYYIHVIKKIP